MVKNKKGMNDWRKLQLQWKDSQNIATNSLEYKASSFAYVNTVDLFCISIQTY